MMKLIRKYLIAGLLFWVPVWVTFLLMRFLIRLMDQSLKLLPRIYQPDYLLGFHIPGLGLIFTIILLFVTGILVTNILGARLLQIWDRLIGRIPLVRSVYSAVKQTVETVFHPKGKAFRRVLLVEYPRKGLWSVAFQTAQSTSEINEKSQLDMVTIFIPTTPNPTSGFLMMVPVADTRELNMSVDQALKFIISLGVVQSPTISKQIKSE